MKKLSIILAIIALLGNVYGQGYYFDKDLVAHYKLDKNGLDETNFHNDGTVYNAQWVSDRFGNTSSAMYFDASSYIQVPNSTSLNPKNEITISAWVKPVSFLGTGNNVIVSKEYSTYNSPYYQYHLGLNGDLNATPSVFRTDVTIGGNRKICSTNTNFYKNGEWYFLVSSYDGNYLRLYVNNKIQDSVAVTGKMQDFSQDLFIGTFGHKVSNGTPITIDDVRIYGKALNDKQIDSLYFNKTRTITYNCSVFKNSNILLHIPFDSTVKDEINNLQCLNVGGTFVKNRFDEDKMAIHFNGSAYVKVNNSKYINPDKAITLNIWVKPESFQGTGNNVIVSKGYKSFIEPYYQYHLGINGDKNTNASLFRTDISLDDSRKVLSTGTSFWTKNEWYMLTTTYDYQYLKFYVNGDIIDSSLIPQVEMRDYGKDLYVGTFGHNLSNGTPITVDDLRIYDCALTQAAIKNIYNEPAPVNSIGTDQLSPLKIYPNPVYHSLKVLNLKNQYYYSIYDVFGQKVLEGKTLSNTLDVAKLNEGVYILKILENNKEYNFTFIKISE